MNESRPLAERMRPAKLDDFVGQGLLTGADGVIRKFISAGAMPSLIFWGPPGVGKTTLANILARELNKEFYSLSAISSSVKEVREIIERSEKGGLFKHSPIVFIDEIHRFNKAQQDALLGAVEKGSITLIGATTENPSFEVIPALLSRCRVYVLQPLEREDLLELLNRAAGKDEVLSRMQIDIRETDALIRLSGGDGRKLLNLFEAVVMAGAKNNAVAITDELVMHIAQQVIPLYDKKGEQHYDIISAFIKSVRGSDPNAAVYWLARMLNGGEDILFIARRMIILASEDIGNANPNALVIANNCFQAVNSIGMPEARIILSQTAIYLACSPKSNSAITAIDEARRRAAEEGDLPVPLHLRNAPTKLMKELNYGKDYIYAHSYEGNFAQQEYLPDKLKGTAFYEPGANSKEDEFRKYLKKIWRDYYGY
ncbi:MAG: replication-associated recombination protein A [Bacteroidia bacterium]|nr:replication-associated recombination protein A [Bacteroidia bacterium]